MNTEYNLAGFKAEVILEPIRCYFPNCDKPKSLFAEFLCITPNDKHKGQQIFRPICAEHLDMLQNEVKKHGGYSIWR